MGWGTEGSGPQGLKPASWVAIGGTAEAVPFPVCSLDRVSEQSQRQRAGVSAPHSDSRGSCRPYGTPVSFFSRSPRTSVLGYHLAPLRGWSLLRYRRKAGSSSFASLACRNDKGWGGRA